MGGGGSPGPRAACAHPRTARRRPRRGAHPAYGGPHLGHGRGGSRQAGRRRAPDRGRPMPSPRRPAVAEPGAGGQRRVCGLCQATDGRQSPSRVAGGSGEPAAYVRPQAGGSRQAEWQGAPGSLRLMYGHRRAAAAMPSRRGHGLMRRPTRPPIAGRPECWPVPGERPFGGFPTVLVFPGRDGRSRVAEGHRVATRRRSALDGPSRPGRTLGLTGNPHTSLIPPRHRRAPRSPRPTPPTPPRHPRPSEAPAPRAPHPHRPGHNPSGVRPRRSMALPRTMRSTTSGSRWPIWDSPTSRDLGQVESEWG